MSGQITTNMRGAAVRPAAHVVASSAEAVDIAQRLAARRDRERLLPFAEVEKFSASGLWAITVPAAFGGADVSYKTVAKITEIIAAADGSLGQIPQNHISVMFQIRAVGTAAQQARMFGDVLRGARFGNALAELTANSAQLMKPTGG